MRSLITVCLILSAYIAGLTQSPASGREIELAGLKLLNRGDAAGAAVLFEKAARIDPRDVTNYINLGTAYFKLNRMADATKAFEEAVGLAPGNSAAHNQLGIAYLAASRERDAVGEFRSAISIRSTDSVALYNLGCVYIRTGKFDEARKALLAASDIEPDNLEIRLNLAYAYYREKRFCDALANVKVVTAADPSDETAQILLAGIHAAMRDKAAGDALYASLQHSDPILAAKVLDVLHGSQLLQIRKQPRPR